jgi:hypothetical protein
MPVISVSSSRVGFGGASLAEGCTIRKHRLHSISRRPKVEGFAGITRLHIC